MTGNTLTRAAQLRALVDLVNSSAELVLQEWEKEETEERAQREAENREDLPSVELYTAQRTIISACGSFIELLQAPDERVISLTLAFFQSRSLHIAGEHDIANHLAKADSSSSRGMHLTELSQATGLPARKLGPIMRTLCSAHVFAEVEEGRFTNNRISTALVNNEYLRAWLAICAKYNFSAATQLPEYVASAEVDEQEATGFQRAFGTPLAWYDYAGSDRTTMGLAMVAAGRLGRGVLYDYPWSKLGAATVVDVGGGVGGMSLDLCRRYPHLKLVIQDLGDTVSQAQAVWKQELPGALESKRATFISHDFFEENPVKSGDVYVLRNILHNWSDEQCVKILSKIRPALAAHSRILVIDVVVNTTNGSPDMDCAPPPLLPNYGIASSYAHQMDLTMMAIFGALERTPAQLRDLAYQAGLEVITIRSCRGVLSITELQIRTK